MKKGEHADIIHIEGDTDHPTNRGTLCPKGAALLDIVHAKTRTLYPQVRKPGSDKFERVSWDYALDRIARFMKDDRDKNIVARNNDGVTVNRWTTTGMLAASATTNEPRGRPTRSPAAPGWSSLTIKRVSDTALR